MQVHAYKVSRFTIHTFPGVKYNTGKVIKFSMIQDVDVYQDVKSSAKLYTKFYAY